MNDITLFKSGLPSYLQGIDDTTANLADTSTNRRISIEGGVFRELVGGKEDLPNAIAFSSALMNGEPFTAFASVKNATGS